MIATTEELKLVYGLDKTTCTHEWRQKWVWEFNGSNDRKVPFPNGFYCIHCLEVHE